MGERPHRRLFPPSRGDAGTHLLTLRPRSLVARGQTTLITPFGEERSKGTLDPDVTLFHSVPLFGERPRDLVWPTAGCPSDQPDDDSGGRRRPRVKGRPRNDIPPTLSVLSRDQRRCLVHCGDDAFAPTPIAEVILRRILDVLLSSQGKNDIIAHVGAHHMISGRHDQDYIPIRPGRSTRAQPLRMIGARIGDHRLIHVVAAETIRRQDYEVNGARETNVLEDGIQGLTTDVTKTPRLVVDLHDGRNRVTGLRCRMNIDVVGSAQPHGRDEE